MTMLNSPASSSQCPSSGGRFSNPPSSDMNSDHQKMCRGKTKVSSSPHRSKQTVSSPLPAQGHSSMPCPNERIPTTPGIITPQAGCSQIPLIGSTPGHTTRNRKRPHDNSTCLVSSSPSVETAAIEKQDPYCAGPSSNFREDPMSTEAAAADLPSTQPPDCKRSKADGSESIDLRKKANASKVPGGSIPAGRHLSMTLDLCIYFAGLLVGCFLFLSVRIVVNSLYSFSCLSPTW
ncbi:hypothetical protein D5086_001794 [Populus alba]|uniref:Uncharacterized protein n=1 Tax=Populus alba TaxID=43335 RepID=A0ACC4D0I1_POPAL